MFAGAAALIARVGGMLAPISAFALGANALFAQTVVQSDSELGSGTAVLDEIQVHVPRLMKPFSMAETSVSDAEDRGGAQLEEVIVRGQRSLAAYRRQLDAARDHVFDVFNALNSDDEFDILCERESRPGTRVPKRVCRPQFSKHVANEAAAEYVAALKHFCGGLKNECIFSETAQHATSQAQAIESEEHYKHLVLADEMQRVMQENGQLRRALLKYEELQREYEEARRR